jgi:hypothetical protein
LGDGWGAAAKCALGLNGDFMDCVDVDRLNNHERDAVHRHAFPVKIKKVSSASNTLDNAALLGFDGTVRFNEVSKRILFQNATDIATHALFTVCALTGDIVSH